MSAASSIPILNKETEINNKINEIKND